MEKKCADGDSLERIHVIKWESIILRSLMVLNDILTHMSTVMKEKEEFLIATVQQTRSSAACCCRTSGPAGAKEEKSCSGLPQMENERKTISN